MRVLVFGTFDGIHEGHRYFLQKAKTLGKSLIVAVARDAHIRDLKHREPRFSEQARLAAISRLEIVDEAYLCDEVLGCYNILTKTKPDMIALGHDQEALGTHLAAWLAQHSGVVPVIAHIDHTVRKDLHETPNLD